MASAPMEPWPRQVKLPAEREPYLIWWMGQYEHGELMHRTKSTLIYHDEDGRIPPSRLPEQNGPYSPHLFLGELPLFQRLTNDKSQCGGIRSRADLLRAKTQSLAKVFCLRTT